MRRPPSPVSASHAGAALLLILVPGLVSSSPKPEDTWIEAPFTGSVTITRSLEGSRTTEGGAFVARSEHSSVRAVVRGCNPDKDSEGRTIGCFP